MKDVDKTVRKNILESKWKADTPVDRQPKVCKVLDHCCPPKRTTRLSCFGLRSSPPRETSCSSPDEPCHEGEKKASLFIDVHYLNKTLLSQALALLGWANSKTPLKLMSLSAWNSLFEIKRVHMHEFQQYQERVTWSVRQVCYHLGLYLLYS